MGNPATSRAVMRAVNLAYELAAERTRARELEAERKQARREERRRLRGERSAAEEGQGDTVSYAFCHVLFLVLIVFRRRYSNTQVQASNGNAASRLSMYLRRVISCAWCWKCCVSRHGCFCAMYPAAFVQMFRLINDIAYVRQSSQTPLLEDHRAMPMGWCPYSCESIIWRIVVD